MVREKVGWRRDADAEAVNNYSACTRGANAALLLAILVVSAFRARLSKSLAQTAEQWAQVSPPPRTVARPSRRA